MAIVQDFRYGLRQLRLNPGFTAVAVLSLALGIGANTAIFELVNAVRLRALPVEKPEQLASIDFQKGANRSGNFSTRSARFTYLQWEQIQAQQQAFSGVIAWSAREFNLASGGEIRWAQGLYVSSNFFSLLGVPPILGRGFTAADDRPGCGSPPALISYGFWQQEFAGTADVLQRKIMLDGRSFPVVGVTPPGFFGVEVGNRYDVAIPLCADAMMSDDGKGRAAGTSSWWISAMGRLKPGWTIERAAAQLRAISPAFMRATLPESYRPDMARKYLLNKLDVLAGANGISGLRSQYEQPLWLLLATTGLVLLIACANLANLLLARASVREREIAVRQAIGASRSRLVAQLMAESLLLALMGTALGGLLAQALSRGLVAFLGEANSGMFLGLALDGRVLGFTAAVAVGTCLLFGLAPAMRATRIAPASAMRAGGRGLTAGRERFSLRRALVVVQVALSLVLLVGALLFLGSLRKLMAVDLGYRVSGLAQADMYLADVHYSREQDARLQHDLLAMVRSIPGVTSAAGVNIVPLSGNGWDGECWADGSTGKRQISDFSSVSPGYFQTMTTPLIAGRDFSEQDTLEAPRVAIVNEAFAKRFFGGTNPIGRTFLVAGNAGQPDDRYRIVGLVGNTKYRSVRENFGPISFVPASQIKDSAPGATIIFRTAVPLSGIFKAIKTGAAQVNPALNLQFTALTRQWQDSLLPDRLMATLAGAFGLLAGLLATIGLYGVISYMVERRRNEIGIRMALGADRGGVVRLVLGEAALLLVFGLAVGAGLTLWAGRAAAALLFDLKPNDAATLAGATALLAAVALAASYAPARRAARLQPMQALREE